MVTESSGHAMVEVNCVWCGESFMARKQRVDKGWGKFCSRKCYNEWQRENNKSNKIGKENATIHWDKARGGYVAVWRDKETNKPTSTTWAHWAWELCHGEVPVGYKVGYKDGNPKNILFENLILQSPNELGQKISKKLIGRTFSRKSKQKMSKAASEKTLSDEHKFNIGRHTAEMWNSGEFDSIHKGEHNAHWKGGIGKKSYPPEFYKISPFIRSRDNHVCQICGKNVYRSRHGHVHHIDGDKTNNDQENLILLCSACHSKVHHPTKETPATILAFSSQLKF